MVSKINTDCLFNFNCELPEMDDAIKALNVLLRPKREPLTSENQTILAKIKPIEAALDGSVSREARILFKSQIRDKIDLLTYEKQSKVEALLDESFDQFKEKFFPNDPYEGAIKELWDQLQKPVNRVCAKRLLAAGNISATLQTLKKETHSRDSLIKFGTKAAYIMEWGGISLAHYRSLASKLVKALLAHHDGFFDLTKRISFKKFICSEMTTQNFIMSYSREILALMNQNILLDQITSINDPNLRRKIAEKGEELAPLFDSGKTFDQFLSLDEKDLETILSNIDLFLSLHEKGIKFSLLMGLESGLREFIIAHCEHVHALHINGVHLDEILQLKSKAIQMEIIRKGLLFSVALQRRGLSMDNFQKFNSKMQFDFLCWCCSDRVPWKVDVIAFLNLEYRWKKFVVENNRIESIARSVRKKVFTFKEAFENLQTGALILL